MNGGRLSMAARAYIVGLSAVAVAVGIALVRTSGSGALVGTFVVLNRVFLAGALWLARGLSPAASGLLLPRLLAADLIIAWIAGPMLVLTLQAGPWMVLVTAGPLLLARTALSVLVPRRRHPARQARARAA